MTWSIPQPDAPKFRKDLMKGMNGVVEGWADLVQRQVHLTITQKLPLGLNQSIINGDLHQ